MKKILLILSSLVLAVSGLVSCDRNENETYNETAVLYVVSTAGDEPVKTLMGNSKTVSVRAEASTVAGEPLSISFRVDEGLVETYNQAHGTSYKLAPANSYKLESASVIMPRYGKSSSSADLTFTAMEEMPMDEVFLLPVVVDKVSGYDNYTVSDPAYIFLCHMSPVKGMGTERFPYLISEPVDLVNMRDQVKHGVRVWFRMTDDVDMSDIGDWAPLNSADPYDYEVDFDGDGHTISNLSSSTRWYPSFFGVVNGSVHDVTFLNPYISGSSAAGVVGGYIGTKTYEAHVYNVRVIGANIFETGTYGVGGIGGRLGGSNCVIENCYVDGHIESTCNQGAAGLIGGENETATVTIRNCFTEGSVKAHLTAGGILGEFWRPDAGIYNCATTASVEGVWAVGGIVGRASGWSSNYKNNVRNKVVGCIAWNDYVKATNDDGKPGHYSSGAIVGFSSIYNTLTDGYRKHDFNFREYPGLDKINVLVDQPNSDPDNPLTVGTSKGASGMYCYPYHGKAAGKDETLCDVAKKLGWDETIWDLSGDKPVLK